jgi:hypothetical protein
MKKTRKINHGGHRGKIAVNHPAYLSDQKA